MYSNTDVVRFKTLFLDTTRLSCIFFVVSFKSNKLLTLEMWKYDKVCRKKEDRNIACSICIGFLKSLSSFVEQFSSPEWSTSLVLYSFEKFLCSTPTKSYYPAKIYVFQWKFLAAAFFGDTFFAINTSCIITILYYLFPWSFLCLVFFFFLSW